MQQYNSEFMTLTNALFLEKVNLTPSTLICWLQKKNP